MAERDLPGASCLLFPGLLSSCARGSGGSGDTGVCPRALGGKGQPLVAEFHRRADGLHCWAQGGTRGLAGLQAGPPCGSLAASLAPPSNWETRTERSPCRRATVSAEGLPGLRVTGEQEQLFLSSLRSTPSAPFRDGAQNRTGAARGSSAQWAATRAAPAPAAPTPPPPCAAPSQTPVEGLSHTQEPGGDTVSFPADAGPRASRGDHLPETSLLLFGNSFLNLISLFLLQMFLLFPH